MSELTWVDVNRPLDGTFDENDVWIEPAAEEMLRPGVLLELADGSYFLIGHVNPRLGRCNCCQLYSGSVVKRYAVVWRGQSD